jgi:hypothetical protein
MAEAKRKLSGFVRRHLMLVFASHLRERTSPFMDPFVAVDFLSASGSNSHCCTSSNVALSQAPCRTIRRKNAINCKLLWLSMIFAFDVLGKTTHLTCI